MTTSRRVRRDRRRHRTELRARASYRAPSRARFVRPTHHVERRQSASDCDCRRRSPTGQLQQVHGGSSTKRIASGTGHRGPSDETDGLRVKSWSDKSVGNRTQLHQITLGQRPGFGRRVVRDQLFSLHDRSTTGDRRVSHPHLAPGPPRSSALVRQRNPAAVAHSCLNYDLRTTRGKGPYASEQMRLAGFEPATSRLSGDNPRPAAR